MMKCTKNIDEIQNLGFPRLVPQFFFEIGRQTPKIHQINFFYLISDALKIKPNSAVFFFINFLGAFGFDTLHQSRVGMYVLFSFLPV
jgi:hypothetical protein